MRAAAALACVAAFATPARADEAGAKALFDEGKTMFAEGKYGAACAKLEASFKLAALSSTRGLLGACYEKIGKLASAWVAYRDAAAIAERQNNPERAQAARDKASELEPKLAHLQIDAAAVAPIAAIDVMIDGVVQPRAALGSALPIDGGPHVISADGVGWKKWATTIDVGDGEHARAVVPMLVEDPGELRATTATVAPKRTRRELVALGVAGGGAAVVSVAIVFGVIAKIDWSSAHCDASGTCPSSAAQTQARSAARYANLGTGFGAAGLAIAGAGLVLYFTAPKRETAPRLAPTAGPGSVGAVLVGRF